MKYVCNTQQNIKQGFLRLVNVNMQIVALLAWSGFNHVLNKWSNQLTEVDQATIKPIIL